MNRKQVAPLHKPAIADKPPLSVVVKPDGAVGPAASVSDASRADRIREAAYRRYEARGCVNGHDLDDWLAAEAEVAGAPPPSLQRQAGTGAG